MRRHPPTESAVTAGEETRGVTWEYRVITESALNLEATLNRLGRDGFEAILSQFAPVSPTNPDARFPEMYNPLVTVILKRSRPPTR